jgi:hypothetical protein
MMSDRQMGTNANAITVHGATSWWTAGEVWIVMSLLYNHENF